MDPRAGAQERSPATDTTTTPTTMNIRDIAHAADDLLGLAFLLRAAPSAHDCFRTASDHLVDAATVATWGASIGAQEASDLLLVAFNAAGAAHEALGIAGDGDLRARMARRAIGNVRDIFQSTRASLHATCGTSF